MKLRIEIRLDNAAFQDNPEEISDLLAELCSRLPQPIRPVNGELAIHDSNGNYVGKATVTNGRRRGRYGAREIMDPR